MWDGGDGEEGMGDSVGESVNISSKVKCQIMQDFTKWSVPFYCLDQGLKELTNKQTKKYPEKKKARPHTGEGFWAVLKKHIQLIKRRIKC